VSTSFELDPVERITAGAVGEPGQRVFYLQARSAGQLVTLLAEKDQVQALAASVEQLLETLSERSLPEDDAVASQDDDLELEEPLLPEWRIGPMALHYDEERDRIIFIASEALTEDAEGTPATASFTATRAQAQALAEHAQEVVASGRPRCRFCGNPMDAEGHTCPAMNGHRELG
jgi:uncharacterized repeat protein (TIGR03847 family)